MFKIESGIELVRSRRGGGRIYPFPDMKVGDSFFFDGGEKQLSSVLASARNFAKKNAGYNFTTRKVDGGFRCWRIPVKE